MKNCKLTSAPGSFHSIPAVKHLTAAISLAEETIAAFWVEDTLLSSDRANKNYILSKFS